MNTMTQTQRLAALVAGEITLALSDYKADCDRWEALTAERRSLYVKAVLTGFGPGLIKRAVAANAPVFEEWAAPLYDLKIEFLEAMLDCIRSSSDQEALRYAEEALLDVRKDHARLLIHTHQQVKAIQALTEIVSK